MSKLRVCVFVYVGGLSWRNGFWVWSPCSHNRNIAVQQSWALHPPHSSPLLTLPHPPSTLHPPPLPCFSVQWRLSIILICFPVGPLSNTVVDFWRLVWQLRPPSIVMVTNLKEGSRVKCEQYWPELGTQEYGPFKVTLTDQQVFADYTIRQLFVSVSFVVVS